MQCFDIKKYMGVWYELAHYPSWFQRNDNYNTKAEYRLQCDGSIEVHNSTISNGKVYYSKGTATVVGQGALNVQFSAEEIKKLAGSGEFKAFTPNLNVRSNYLIDRIWADRDGDYTFAVVTDDSRQSFYLLSRVPNPSLRAYNEIMSYVIEKYDRDRLVQTPHYY